MKAPRIIGSTSEAPPFAGDLPATMGTLAPYTNATKHTAALPVVTTAASTPRLHRRTEIAPMMMLALLAASTITLAVAPGILFRQEIRRGVLGGPVDPPAVAASGRDGADRLHCMSDIVTVTVTRARASAGGVMVAWLEALHGTAQLLLRPANGGYRGYLYVDQGVLRVEPRTAGLAIWPDEQILLRVDGLLGARELHVTGRQLRLGSRGEGTCA